MGDNKLIFADLFTQLQTQIFGIDPNHPYDPLKTGQFMVFAHPGSFISTNASEANMDDLEKQSAVLNVALDSSFLYNTLLGTVDEIYFDMVNNADFPAQSLSDDELKELEGLTAWLSANAVQYANATKAISDAQVAYWRALYSPKPDPVLIYQLKKQLDAVTNQNSTFINLYDAKQRRSISLSNKDPRVLWQQKVAPGQQATQLDSHGQPFYEARLIPPVDEWPTDGGWEHAVLDVGSSQSSYYASATHWEASGGVSFGLWSVGANAGGTTTYQHGDSDTESFHIDLEFRRVKINRNAWMYEPALSLTSWRFGSPGHPALSDGGNLLATPPVRPIGSMPVLSHEVLAVRNVTIGANWAHNDNTQWTSEFHASASFGWGPFSMGGSYSNSAQGGNTKADWQNGVITIKEPQIIAYLCTVLPKCPNPDPSLHWDKPFSEFALGFTPAYNELKYAARASEDVAYQFERIKAKHAANYQGELNQIRAGLFKEYRAKAAKSGKA